MDKFIRQFIFYKFEYKDATSEDYITKFLCLCISSFFFVAVHCVLSVFFLLAGITELVYFCVLAVLIYLAILYLTYVKSKFILSNISEVFQVIINTTAIVYFIGADNNIILYFLALLVLQFIMPNDTYRIRIFIYSLICLCAVIVVYMQVSREPVYTISEENKVFFTFFNTFVAFLIVSAEVYFSNIVKRFAGDYKAEQLLKIEKSANTDHLTGLYNRRYADTFFSLLADEKDEKPKCVALLDIDNYKQVNDKYGHNAGDAVLVNIAKIMSKTLRKTDVLIRWGGEEFLIILDNVSIDTAYSILNKLRVNIYDYKNDMPEGFINVSVTIGVAEFEFDNPMKSIEKCDNNLYEGKRTGKNKVVK